MRRDAEAAELAARKNVGMVDALIAAQKRSTFGIDDPGNFSFWKGVPEERGGRQSMYDIPEGTRFDNEDGGNIGFQNRLVIPGAKEGSRGEMLKKTPRDRWAPQYCARA